MGERTTTGKLPHLFSPLTIAGRSLRNRIHMPSMHTALPNEDGSVSARLLAFLEARIPHVGMLTLEQATVTKSARRTSASQLAIWDDSFVPGLSMVADMAHRYGTVAIVQISHPGRQTTREAMGAQPVAPSAVTCLSFPNPPRELEGHEIPALQQYYVDAALRARRAGLDGVELHAGHGFLMAQFLSPYFNRRQDEYGGDTLRRARFVTEVIEAIRHQVGRDWIIQLRLSIVEGIEGGLTVEESQRLAVLFAKAGIDSLHCSAGMAFNRYLYSAPIGVVPGHNLPLAAAMKAVLDIPVIAAGRLQFPELAETAIRTGQADMVTIGRGLICDPSLPEKAAREELSSIRYCISCNQGCTIRPVACTLNAQAGHELDKLLIPATVRKTVAVVGGGPAGLEAARVAALRGHKVRLYEKQQNLGGMFILGSRPPGKAELLSWVRYAERELRSMGVEIHLGVEASPTTFASEKPNHIILACGGVPFRPPIPGIDLPSVVSALDLLDGRAVAGQIVVVIGGGETGCETADYLASRGHKVTVVEMLPEMAREVPREQRHFLFQRLDQAGVELISSAKVAQVLPDGLSVETAEGPAHLSANTVVLATGAKPNMAITDSFREVGSKVHIIGDACNPGNALQAIHQGFDAGCAL